MALTERIRSDLEKALRQGDTLRRSVLRMVLSAMNYAEIDQQKTLDDVGVIDVLSREAKKRRESIEAFEKGNRPDLVAQEKAELAIISEYLPQQISREEIMTLARKIVSEVGATGPVDKGKVMSKIIPQTKGKAEGKVVNDIVSEILNSL
jgi:uncharacterized protein YqeY